MMKFSTIVFFSLIAVTGISSKGVCLDEKEVKTVSLEISSDCSSKALSTLYKKLDGKTKATKPKPKNLDKNL